MKKIGQKKKIVKSIYFKGPVSSSELSRDLSLSTPKINSLLQELIADGLLKELGQGHSSGGRRPAIYGLVENGFYVVGITVNIYGTIISIFNARNKEISGPHYVSVPMRRDFGMFAEINREFQEILSSSEIDRKKIIGIGIELPGLVNQEQGVNRTYFPDVENLPTKIAEVFGYPVFIDNDARMRTFAEQQFGLAKARNNVLMVHADWGIGLGLIVNGQLYAGKSGFSGEFGHIPMIDNGVLCHCGKRGCLEAIASVSAIARIAQEGLEAENPSLLPNLVDNDLSKIDTAAVIKAAQVGDQFSISILTDVGLWLGRGITSLIQIFNPELIIIGGKMAEASQFLQAPIYQSIYTYANPDISNDTEIVFSVMGVKAGTIGAAAFAVDKLAS
ncbi:MAG: ROK family protein [Prolixibacteraceae bacterium]|nr:ROK family protein [Prolixibacteraceae bacterium]